MAPKSAKASALGSTATILPQARSGSSGMGIVDGIPPKREPIVSTRKSSKAAANEASATAISNPGQCGRYRLSPSAAPMVRRASSSVTESKVGNASHRTGSFSRIGAGSGPRKTKPKRSLIWLAKMTTAIPAVKPTVTG